MFQTQVASSSYKYQMKTTIDGKYFRPTPETDAATQKSIYYILSKDDLRQALEYYELDIRVKNGIVSLKGHIMSATSKRRIEDAILSIPDIFDIKDDLVLDDTLAFEVAASLATLEHTYDCKFFTSVFHGVVSLSGIGNDENVKLLAGKCAAANPNVRGVVNNVRVAGARPGLQNAPFLQPSIGAIIYFSDGIFGAVKQVIINPNNRCVIQVVVQGQIPGQEPDLNTLTDNRAEILKKTIVIPVNLIRYLTKNSGFLNIKSTDITGYEDFNPLYFSAPKFDWISPYPYAREDVLFAVDAGEIANRVMVAPDIAQINVAAQPTSPQKTENPVDTLAAWEDDGGKMVQTAPAKPAPALHEVVGV